MAKNDIDMEKVEQDIVSALVEAGEWNAPVAEEELPTVIIKDRHTGEKVLFQFRIHALNEDDWAKCRRQNLKNRGRLTEELNTGRFSSQAIYEATVDEDKDRLWKNKAAWKKYNVNSGVDLVHAILRPAEKDKIIGVLSQLGGFDDSGLDDLIKN